MMTKTACTEDRFILFVLMKPNIDDVNDNISSFNGQGFDIEWGGGGMSAWP